MANFNVTQEGRRPRSWRRCSRDQGDGDGAATDRAVVHFAESRTGANPDSAESAWLWMGCGAAFYLVAWGVGRAIMAGLRRLWRKNRGKPKKAMVRFPRWWRSSPLAGAAGGPASRDLRIAASHLLILDRPSVGCVVGSGSGAAAIILIVGTLHVADLVGTRKSRWTWCGSGGRDPAEI